MSQPPEEVENVMKAMLLLLGEEETGKNGLYEHDGKTTWKFVAPKLKGSGKDGILRRLLFYLTSIDPYQTTTTKIHCVI